MLLLTADMSTSSTRRSTCTSFPRLPASVSTPRLPGTVSYAQAFWVLRVKFMCWPVDARGLSTRAQGFHATPNRRIACGDIWKLPRREAVRGPSSSSPAKNHGKPWKPWPRNAETMLAIRADHARLQGL